MRNKWSVAGAAALLLATASAALAAGFYTNGVPPAGGTQYPSTIPLTGNEAAGFDTNLTQGLNPASEAVSIAQLRADGRGQGNTAGFRNALIGGDFGTNPWQRETSLTGIANTLTYVADRWWNLGGASSSISVTKETGASDHPTTFSASDRFQRASSNTDTTAICTGQVLESIDSLRFAGSVAELDIWMLSGANFSAASNNVQVTISYGTGTNQSAANFAAGSWTGQANAVQSNVAISTTWTRYVVTGSVPTTATQIGVKLCYTPVGTAGTNDWFEFTGTQLGPNNAIKSGLAQAVGNAVQASSFEHRPAATETALSLRYAYVITEAAAGVLQTTTGNTLASSTTCTLGLPFPVVMRTAPTYTNSLTSSTFKLVSASQTATALSTPFSATSTANTPNMASIAFTTSGMTAKDGCYVVGAGGGGTMVWSAEL